MDASTPTIVSGAGDVSSRQSHAPGLRGDVIHTQQLEHPSTRSTSSKILAVIFAIYHVIYSVAWLIEFIVWIDYVDNIRWIPLMATGGISFLFIGILEHFTRTKKHSTNIAMLMFTIVGLVAVNITFLWSELTVIIYAEDGDIEENIFPCAVATVLLSLGEIIVLLWNAGKCVTVSGPIDCPTFPTTTSRGIGGAQWLNAFVVTIPGLTVFWMEDFDPIAMVNFIIFLISLLAGLSAFIAAGTLKKSAVTAFLVLSTLIVPCTFVILVSSLIDMKNGDRLFYSRERSEEYYYARRDLYKLDIGYISIAVYFEQIGLSIWSIVVCGKTLSASGTSGDENRDTVAVTENSSGSQFRAAQQSEYPMQRRSQQTRQGRGPNDEAYMTLDDRGQSAMPSTYRTLRTYETLDDRRKSSMPENYRTLETYMTLDDRRESAMPPTYRTLGPQ